jgi:hypothetical protein
MVLSKLVPHDKYELNIYARPPLEHGSAYLSQCTQRRAVHRLLVNGLLPHGFAPKQITEEKRALVPRLTEPEQQDTIRFIEAEAN